MGSLLSKLAAGVLASAIALAVAAPLNAAPMSGPRLPTAGSDVVPVVSSRVVRRGSPHRHAPVQKKGRHRGERHDGVSAERHRGKTHGAWRRHHKGGDWLYRPKATPKYAYDAYGNLRVYDGDGWNDRREWDGRRHRKDRLRPLIVRKSSRSTVPSPELQQILTAAPKLQ